jgi:hypothetical protein
MIEARDLNEAIQVASRARFGSIEVAAGCRGVRPDSRYGLSEVART